MLAIIAQITIRIIMIIAKIISQSMIEIKNTGDIDKLKEIVFFLSMIMLLFQTLLEWWLWSG